MVQWALRCLNKMLLRRHVGKFWTLLMFSEAAKEREIFMQDL